MPTRWLLRNKGDARFQAIKFKENVCIVINVLCSECGMKFEDEKRLKIHRNTHKKRELKGKKQKQSSTLPDFDKPDFSQVM